MTMRCRLSTGLPHSALPDTVRVGRAMQDVLHEDARRMHLVRLDLARLDEVLDLRERDACGGGHHRVEVPGGLAKDEVASAVADERTDEREVGLQRHLQHEVTPVDDARLFPFGDDRSVAGRSEEAADAGAAGADALGEGALRHQFDLELAGEELPFELLVFADIGRDHLADLLRLEDRPEAEVVDAGVVADDREVLRATTQQRGQEVLGIAADADPAHHQRRAVWDPRDGLVGGAEDLVHTADYYTGVFNG